MYLVDTNVVSEQRKRSAANPGVRQFFRDAVAENDHLFLSVVTVGELRRGVEMIRHRNDVRQARRLEEWLESLLIGYAERILEVDGDVAQIWGRLRVPRAENALDKLIAATALVYDLTVVTRNHKHFADIGVRVLNPFV